MGSDSDYPEFFVEENDEENTWQDSCNPCEIPVETDGNNHTTEDEIDWAALEAAAQENGDADMTVDPERLAELETPEPPPKKRNRVDAPRKNVRKRVANAETWKKNISKAALNSGQAYITSSGKERNAKVLRPGCTVKCNRCSERITQEQRQAIFDNFYELANHQRQLDYIAGCIKAKSPKQKYAAPGNKGCSVIREYSFKIKGNDSKKTKEVKVCKKMFVDTLVISDSWIKTALSGEAAGVAAQDMRGRHGNRGNKVSDQIKESVRAHINLIPKIESHYTRERTKRLYVETENNIEELYRKYKLWAQDQGMDKIASSRTYRKIYLEEFNIGRFIPKNDLCLQCNRWKHATTEEKRNLARQNAIHCQNRNISQGIKKAERLQAQAQTDGEVLCVASFDMEKVLTIPKSEVSSFYYKTKVSLINFTIFDMGPKLGQCYMWNETVAKKSSNEVATCTYFFIGKKCESNPEVKKLSFWSDNPTSQNKNRQVFSMYRLASVKYNVEITHKFLEVGHTHMEVDSMHAAIERSVYKKEIYDQEEWYDYVRNAKKNVPDNNPAEKYEIIKVGEDLEVLDFKKLVSVQNWTKDTSNNNVKWTKVREIHFSPQEPDIVKIKYEYNGDYVILNTTKKRGRPINLKTYQPPTAYLSLFPLPENKIKDLKDLMNCGAIPPKYHPFYEDLISIGVGPPEEECDEDCILCENQNADDDAGDDTELDLLLQ